ncbi:hypothetical protein GOP47_0024084 [Adiantum capillus-veneris]|uniref:RRM domain-containing protein n=1 Tax=Adiantum capillus-veneris TaxID=13818 RepID=A0A9D4U4S1_ADICA|nr:hypothetical protein GOP47_0024084 [Adiantum capillus-veneris]
MEQKKRKAEEQNGAVMEDVATAEDIAEIVESLSKEQLAGIVKQAAIAHADTLADVRKFADEDPAFRKLFVRGLSWTSGSDVLKRAFEKYGPVDEAVVINDKNTGKSKGFGFVTFKHRDACIRALKEPSKKIEGRMTVCHLSGAASSNPSVSGVATIQAPLESVACRKIYVGNIPKSAQGGALLEFFSQFGEIEEGPLGFDRDTGKCKGFALFIYKSSESARKCLEEPMKKFGGQQVQCKLAESGKGKDEGAASLTASVLGYDITNPTAISSYNPSFLQTNTQSIGQSLLQPGALSSYGFQGLDPLGIRTSSLLGADTGYTPGSIASVFGLGAASQSSLLQGPRGSTALPSLQNNAAQGPGYPSLPRSFY